MLEELSDIFTKNWYKLVDLNIELFMMIKEKLEISSRIIKAIELNNIMGVGSECNFYICKTLGADKYYQVKVLKNIMMKTHYKLKHRNHLQ